MTMQSPDELAEHFRYAKDASGHEHVGKGTPEGGQFTGMGEDQHPDAMAAKLKMATQEPSNTPTVLTEDENAAIEYYRDSGHESINDVLRGTNARGSTNRGAAPDKDFLLETVIPALDSAIDKHVLGRDITVYRGAGHSGKHGIDLGYTSVTTDKKVAESFASKHGGTVKSFVLKKGSKALPVQGEEAELLLPRHKSDDRAQTVPAARYAKDASGHEHVAAGSSAGGQFTGGAGQHPDEMAAKLGGGATQSNPIDDALGALLDKEKISRSNADGLDPAWVNAELKASGISATSQEIEAAGQRIVAAHRADPKAAPTAKAVKPKSAAKPLPSPNELASSLKKAAVVSQPAPSPVAEKPVESSTSATGSSEQIAKKIESLSGAEAGYAHGGATMTAAYPVAKMLSGTKFSGNISPEAVAAVLDEHGIIGESVGADRRLRVEIINPKALRAILEAATSGTHDGLPVASSMNLRRVAQAVSPAR